jgi:hypothetical protein
LECCHRDQVSSDWERLWSIEIERRMTDVVAGRVQLVDAGEVHVELRAELRNRCR